MTPAGYALAKRALDLVGALCGLLILLPLLPLLVVMIRLDSRGPIFYRRRVLARQRYTGGSPRTFDAFKFRTMVVDADAILADDPELTALYRRDFKLRDDPRVTRLGRFLRAASLDELPQLFNVLLGQMSLVGPRMITEPELERYGDAGAQLLTVSPGLTGLWQVSGRQELPYAERVRLDLAYVEGRSLLLDLTILLRTVGSVLRRRGAY